VLVAPARVQGEGAAQEIADAIALVNRLPDIEVMIVGRGGGSIEDLWPFNEEVVARAIAASRVPVISAVGHETDFTISDFVADVRALTPTDAGNLVVPDARQLAESLKSLGRRMGQALAGCADSSRERLAGLALRCKPRRFLDRIRDREQNLDELCQRLFRDARRALLFQEQQLRAFSGRLDSLSPLSVLRRGYSITLREPQGACVRDAAQLRPGDLVRTRLSAGQFRSRVETIEDE
jgi:exodeoxyribonuclease VII large subunit